MWTAAAAADRLRRELAFGRLTVKLLECRPDDPVYSARWVVCVRVPTLTGRRRWPVTLHEDGTVDAGGATTIREVSLKDEIVYVHETDAGQYLELEPSFMRRELELRDAHRIDTRRRLRDAVARKRATIRRDLDDDIAQRTKYYRRAFARFMRGEETGLFR